MAVLRLLRSLVPFGAISQKAQALRPNADFSAAIRAGLPTPTARAR